MSWYLMVWKRALDFSGRSRRKEYWMFVLFNVIVAFILGIVDVMVFGAGTPEEPAMAVFYPLYALAVIIPSIAVGVRRLHDIGKSGWWLLIGFIPLIGAIILLVWACTDSEEGANDYGPNPKADEA